MTLKVAHSHWTWLTQTQTWIYKQVCHLPADRVEAHVVCDRTENLDQFPVPHLHSMDDGRLYHFWRAKVRRKLGLRRQPAFLRSVSRRIGAQIVHSHFGDTGWRDLGVARDIGARHVVTFYGYDLSHLPVVEPVWHDRYADLFSEVDLVLCEGVAMGKSVMQLGCPAEKLRVHHLGIEPDEVPFRPRQWTPGSALRVLIAASFVEKKGIPYALAALAALKDEVPLEVTVIGDARSEPRSKQEKVRIQETLERGGLKSRVSMLGFQPHSRLFQEAFRHHIFLSPSVTAQDGDTEGGAPVTIIEMAATGMPIVSTHHCDIPSVIDDGRTGLLAAERDVDGLVHHLRWLIRHPDAWQAMVEAGRHHIEQEYDARRQGHVLAGLYEELVRRPTKSMDDTVLEQFESPGG